MSMSGCLANAVDDGPLQDQGRREDQTGTPDMRPVEMTPDIAPDADVDVSCTPPGVEVLCREEGLECGMAEIMLCGGPSMVDCGMCRNVNRECVDNECVKP